MKTKIFHSAPAEALEIRQKVFVEEQGFQNEFDEIDLTAAHLLVWDDAGLPAATCRIFQDKTKDFYILGRLAVRKEYRGKHVGAFVVEKAENYVREIGGIELRLHAQCQAAGFYQKLGFSSFGEIEDDEGYPHIWMKKELF